MRFLIQQWLKFLLAALLAAAPILPAFAFSEHADAGAAHALSAADGRADDQAHQAPAERMKSSPCDKHDDCQGQCCAVCAQCFTASIALVMASAPARPIQTPTVRELQDSLFVTFLNRPPQRG